MKSLIFIIKTFFFKVYIFALSLTFEYLFEIYANIW